MMDADPVDPTRRIADGTEMDARDDAEAVLPLAEERMSVGKREVVRESTLAVRTRAEDVEVAETLTHTGVRVERVPLGTVMAEPPGERTEADGTTVIPVVEEVLVKQYRVIEEIRLTPFSEEHEHRETVTLRRQTADLIEGADVAGGAIEGADRP